GSGGVPRLVNILSHKSLMASFGEGEHKVHAKHVRAAIEDTDEARSVAQRRSMVDTARRWWRRVSGSAA
ncbi:MAG: hypothetical protein ACKPBA_06460, partial [Planctomycetota bacterium]